MMEAIKQEGLERPQWRRDPITGKWVYVTSRDMLAAERTRHAVQREVQQLQGWVEERNHRQRRDILAGLREQMRP